MHAIKATWTQGRILPSEPVDWPEGSELLVEPIALNGDKMGLTEDEWQDDAEAIAAKSRSTRRWLPYSRSEPAGPKGP